MWLKQGQIEVDSGDENEFGSGECGDACGAGHAKKTNISIFPHPPLYPPNNTLPNQSKPIVPLLILVHYNFSYNLIIFNYIKRFHEKER